MSKTKDVISAGKCGVNNNDRLMDSLCDIKFVAMAIIDI